ncbi:MAG: AbrB/MazE/SpoVT family DNA-binding domain-containing protein [Synergistaceae bacterium]|nr:AbrB/MazE/SpoVT family DNA-binding domain-containing protein [Synergistaceae bacterium]
MCYVTTVSSKGQVVIPKTIREQLNLESGRPLVVFSDGSNILLKPIPRPDISEFRALMDATAAWAKEVGLTEEDITDAIKTVRRR